MKCVLDTCGSNDGPNYTGEFMQTITETIERIKNAPLTNKKADVTYHKVKVTPTLAQEILAAQGPDTNRRLDSFQVNRLAELIKAGKWNEDVDSVKVSKTGRLLDGQHRLNAVIKAAKPVMMLFATGVPEDAIKYVDTGKRRTTGQTLQILGQQVSAIRLAAANLLAHFERLGSRQSDPQSITARFATLDPDSVLEVLERYEKELGDMGSVLNEHNAAAVYAPLVYAAKRFPKEAAMAMEFIKDGQVAGDPILAKFHAAQKRLSRKDLGSGTDRAEASLLVLDLVKAIVNGKPPKALTKVDEGAQAHADLLRFFSAEHLN
jgi:hypothetical protein